MLWAFGALACLVVLVTVERAWWFWSTHVDVTALAERFRGHVAVRDFNAALAAMAESPSSMRGVLLAGLTEAERGHDAALHAIAGAKVLYRLQLEARTGPLFLIAVTVHVGGAATALLWSAPDFAAAGLAVSVLALVPLVAIHRLAVERMAVAGALAATLLSLLASTED